MRRVLAVVGAIGLALGVSACSTPVNEEAYAACRAINDAIASAKLSQTEILTDPESSKAKFQDMIDAIEPHGERVSRLTSSLHAFKDALPTAPLGQATDVDLALLDAAIADLYASIEHHESVCAAYY